MLLKWMLPCTWLHDPLVLRVVMTRSSLTLRCQSPGAVRRHLVQKRQRFQLGVAWDWHAATVPELPF